MSNVRAAQVRHLVEPPIVDLIRFHRTSRKERSRGIGEDPRAAIEHELQRSLCVVGIIDMKSDLGGSLLGIEDQYKMVDGPFWEAQHMDDRRPATSEPVEKLSCDSLLLFRAEGEDHAPVAALKVGFPGTRQHRF